MPKPTRRARRKLAEQGKLAPRRTPANVPERVVSIEPRERMSAISRKATTMTPVEPPRLSEANDYAYVKADLMRILLLAGTLIGVMVALKFVLPQ